MINFPGKAGLYNTCCVNKILFESYAKYTIMNIISLSRLLLMPLLAATTAGNAAAQSAGLPLREGVVIDQSRNTAYIIAPDKTLKAISLSNGTAQWTSPDSLKPLSIINGKLLAQAVSSRNELVITQLDMTQRGRLINRNTISLPAKVKADFRPSVSSMFRTFTRVINGQTYILWEHQEAPLRGMPDNDTAINTGPVVQSGIIRVEGTTGRLTTAQKSALPPAQLNKRIKLNRQEGIEGRGEQQFLSIDENHILASRRITGNEEFFNYAWEIFERASGNKVGELRDYRSFAPFYVTGTTLIYEIGPYARMVNGSLQQVPLHLAAINLTNGRELWRTPIFDEVNRMSPPPGMQ